MGDRVAQFLGEVRGCRLTSGATLIILTAYQFVLDRVAHQEADVIPHVDCLVNQGTEIRLDEHSRLSRQTGNLVEQSAFATGVFVFRLLSDLGERNGFDRDSVEFGKAKSRTHLQRGGRRETATQRDVPQKHSQKTFFDVVSLDQSGKGTLYVVLPSVVLFVRTDVVQVENNLVHQVRGNQSAFGRATRCRREESAAVDCRREDESLVVVRVVAQHLDPSGGVRDGRRLPAELLDKLFQQFPIDAFVLHGVPLLISFRE